MPLWGNNDSANSKPLLPEERQVNPVATLTTSNVTVTGSATIVFTSAIPSTVVAGAFVYSQDANNAVSRLYDGSLVDQNDVSFLKSNNTVAAVTDAANGIVRLTNPIIATLASGQTIWFANTTNYNSNTANTYFSDTILVTASRSQNTQSGTVNVASPILAANVGSITAGWVRITKKTNNDGTIRYLKETLIALANASASNTSSGNTSFGPFVSGL